MDDVVSGDATPVSYPKRDILTRVTLSVILYASACSCAPMNRVPMTLRPDTRIIATVIVDSLPVAQTLAILRAALPNEAAVCYTGVLRDTVTADSVHALVLHLTGAQSARQDSADAHNVWFHNDGAVEPCDHPMAVGHSHPNLGYECDESDHDSSLLFDETAALVSLAWCMNGEVQFFYQDGRRHLQRWRN